jgi:hypothetical protein
MLAMELNANFRLFQFVSQVSEASEQYRRQNRQALSGFFILDDC